MHKQISELHVRAVCKAEDERLNRGARGSIQETTQAHWLR
jgi:hypothetical protein